MGPYFCEEIRQYLERTYGEKDLYRRGLRVDSTLDPELQAFSEEALGWGLRRLARRHGFQPPRNLLASRDTRTLDVLRGSLVGRRDASENGDAFAGVVTEVSKTGAPRCASQRRRTGPPACGLFLDRRKVRRRQILKPGRPRHRDPRRRARTATPALSLEQDPREQGAVMILENSSGAVRAMVGGYDWTQSKFNRPRRRCARRARPSSRSSTSRRSRPDTRLRTRSSTARSRSCTTRGSRLQPRATTTAVTGAS